MTEETPRPGSHFVMEESSITGGKSVSEILHILRTNADIKLNKVREFEDVEETTNRSSNSFPWVKRFTAQLREVLFNPDIKKFDLLISTFCKHIENSAEECYKRPIRAHNLKTRISDLLPVFNWMYLQMRQPFENSSYLDKMSDIMAIYIDLELKSSRRGREHPKKISERISSFLYTFLDNSIEDILDTVLKAKFFIKKYSDICCPVIAKLLQEKPGPLYEATYVRYLLSFKLWKKLAGKESYASINKEAVAKLIPPPDFAEKLKTGLFANVLPYVSRSEKDRITFFFMQSPFNIKKKAQVFLKDEKKIHPNLDLERRPFFDDDVQITSFFNEESEESNNQPNALMNDIWNNMVEKEDDFLDNPIIPMDKIESKEEENIIIDLRKTKTKEKLKKTTKATNGVLKTSLKKRKALKVNSNLVKSISNKDIVLDFIKSDLGNPINSIISNEDNTVVSSIKSEDVLSSLIGSPEQKPPKPCATVEPAAQSKEVTDSLSNVSEVFPIKLLQSPATANPVRRQDARSIDEELSCNKESATMAIVTNTERAIVNPTISTEEAHEETPVDIVDSSGIQEEAKSETHLNYLFEEPSDTNFKIGKANDSEIIADDFVANEVEISSDSVQTFLYLGNDGKTDIMNVIEIPQVDCTAFSNEEIVIQTDTSTKELDKQGNNYKEKSNPENQFLSSIIASTETSETYVPVTLLRRQDSYHLNDIFLKDFLSDPATVDDTVDGSDDDSRFERHRRFAGGGKLAAFRDRMEDPKSDNDEDFDSPTPSSDCQQPSPLDTSLETVNLQRSSQPDSDQELKNQNQILEESHVASLSDRDEGEKMIGQEEPRIMKELSIHLSAGDVTSANKHISNAGKISPKGMFEPPDGVLHFKTVDFHYKLGLKQIKLYDSYNTGNIFESDPAQYPPSHAVTYPINGYVRCPCFICEEAHANVIKNFHYLYQLRTSKIVSAVDKNRFLSRIIDSKLEDDKLLKSIEDTITKNSHEDLNPGTKTGCTVDPENKSDEKKILKSDSPGLELKTKEVENELESSELCESSEIQSTTEARLPPKKRKAFSVDLKATDDAYVHHSENKNLKLDSNKGTGEQRPHSNDQTGKHETSPVKIKSVNGSYCVVGEVKESHSEAEPSESSRKKCKRKCKNKCKPKEEKRLHETKEEKRLRREQKRLQKLEKGKASSK